MLRSLSVATLLTVALVPLGAGQASATTSTARAHPAPMAGAPWKSSATRRALPRPATTPVAAPTVPRSSISPTQAYQDRVLVATNLERSRAGLAPLRLSSCADGFADRWAGALRAAGALSHQTMSPILSTCAARAVGENVAFGNVSPEGLVALWMASPPHRANILTPTFNQLGVGATSDAQGRWYGVQVFLTA